MDEESRALAAALLARLNSETPRAPVITFGDLLKEWRKAHERLPSFACDYSRAQRILGLEPFELRDEEGEHRLAFWHPSESPLHARDVATIRGDDVDDFRVWFYAQETRRKGAPTTATVNRYVMMLKRILNHAVKRNKIQRSPLLGVDDEDEDNAREVVIEEDQFELLLHALDSPMMRALVTLGYDSGMRKTELLSCRWSWLDADAGQVHIPGAIAKNGEKRTTDLSPRAWDAMGELPRTVRGDVVFFNPDTAEPYGGRWIHERFVRAVERAGIVGRDGTAPRMHDLRRSFVTLMGRRGVPESVIMAKSGHRDHKVFSRYRIVNEVELRDAWVLMEAGRQRDLVTLAARRMGPQRSPANVAAEPSKTTAKHA